MTRMIYMVSMDTREGKNLGTCLFERNDTAQVYAEAVRGTGGLATVIPRLVLSDGPGELVFKNEVALAS